MANGEKKQYMTALLLSVFLGGLGVDRFYPAIRYWAS